MQISRRRKAFLFTVTGIILLTTSTLISYAIDAARFVITERPGEIFFFSSRTRPLTGFIFHSTDYGRAPSLPAMEPLPDPDFEPRLLYYHQRSNALIIRGLVGDGGPETRYIRISHDYGQTFDYERNNIRVLSPRLYPHSDSLLFCNGADKWSYDTLQTSVEYPMDGVPRTHTSSTRTIWDNIQIVGLKTLEADREENPFDLRVFYSQDRAHTTQYAENDGWPFWYEYPPDAIYSGYQSGELWMTWLNDLYHTTDWGDNWTLLQQFRGEDEFAVDLTPYIVPGWEPNEVFAYWAGYRIHDGEYGCAVYYSDDHGATFTRTFSWWSDDENAVPELSVPLPSEQYSIWPNPTNGQISIQVNKQNLPIKIYDILGHVVLSYPRSPHTTRSIDLGELPTGNYFVEIPGMPVKNISLIK